jgi:exopolyphosphatase / guanosine-5'-triphosphate,3'-diphosphate pyrophosphatase
VRALSADDEGRLAFDGAVARCADDVPEVIGVVDVGGGSTEIVVGTLRGGPGWVRSVDLGSLRLTRLFLRDDPPGRRRVTWARAAVREALADLRPIRPDVAFAAGGSARGLARILGRSVGADALDDAIGYLARRRSTKVARAHGLEPNRARTLLAGAILLAEASGTLDRPLTLARGGLREGAALALATAGAAAAA